MSRDKTLPGNGTEDNLRAEWNIEPIQLGKLNIQKTLNHLELCLHNTK